MSEFRARCKKHKDFAGPWRRWNALVQADLAAHLRSAHPDVKHPKRAARKARVKP